MLILTQKQPKNMWSASTADFPHPFMPSQKTEALAVAELMRVICLAGLRSEINQEMLRADLANRRGVGVVRQ